MREQLRRGTGHERARGASAYPRRSNRGRKSSSDIFPSDRGPIMAPPPPPPPLLHKENALEIPVTHSGESFAMV
jgi:hypothetical protein